MVNIQSVAAEIRQGKRKKKKKKKEKKKKERNHMAKI